MVILKSSLQLFEYFVRKGANINFIGDQYAYETEDSINQETLEWGLTRYYTCLDFALLKLEDDFLIHYNFKVPSKEDIVHQELKEDRVVIEKEALNDLLEQAQYLKNLIFTDKIITFIKLNGGKTYVELKTKKVDSVQ